MRTRSASLATIVIAIGLALTTIGIARGLPHEFAGLGSRTTIAADAWAHGTAVSPALVALVAIGLLATIAARPTRGGRRAAAWLAVLATTVAATGLLEPVQGRVLAFGESDLGLTALVYGQIVGLVALAIVAALDARDPADRTEPGPAVAAVAPV